MIEPNIMKWVTTILNRESANKTFGTVTFHMQNGVIRSSEIKNSEKAPEPVK